MLKQAHRYGIPYILACHLQIDEDPAYHFDADPDPTFQFNVDICGSGSTTLQQGLKKPERSSLEGLVHAPFVRAEDGLINESCKSNREPMYYVVFF